MKRSTLIILPIALIAGSGLYANMQDDIRLGDETKIAITKENKLLSEDRFISKDKGKCEADGGMYEIQIDEKVQNTPTTTDPIRTITLRCTK